MKKRKEKSKIKSKWKILDSNLKTNIPFLGTHPSVHVSIPCVPLLMQFQWSPQFPCLIHFVTITLIENHWTEIRNVLLIKDKSMNLI